jgi:dTDP-4-dehydrorhamnose 3,5-epimerase
MEFAETSIPGVMRITPTPHYDTRGHFARTYCQKSFAEHGLEQPTAQMALSHNSKKGTLRGLHFIPVAEGESKLVRCVRGAIFDVAVDLRPTSSTFHQWTSIELSAENMEAFYIPRGVAHGFVTLTDDADILYQFSEPHRAGLEKGVAWNDPDIAVAWPVSPTMMSSRDEALPLLSQIGSLT